MDRTKKRRDAVPVRDPSRVVAVKVMSFTPEVDSFEELSSSGKLPNGALGEDVPACTQWTVPEPPGHDQPPEDTGAREIPSGSTRSSRTPTERERNGACVTTAPMDAPAIITFELVAWIPTCRGSDWGPETLSSWLTVPRTTRPVAKEAARSTAQRTA
jgi:hypothetical protein